VSVADIESDGPFSAFPGVRRFFAVLDGAGVELTIDGRSQQVTRGDDAVTFSGEAATSCRLIAGPTRDLNLMVRDAEGAMQRASAGQVWQPVARACGLFATATGHCRAGEHATALPAYALLWFDAAPAALAFDASGWWLAA